MPFVECKLRWALFEGNLNNIFCQPLLFCYFAKQLLNFLGYSL